MGLTAAILLGRNNETLLHENRFHFPEEIILLFLPNKMVALRSLYNTEGKVECSDWQMTRTYF